MNFLKKRKGKNQSSQTAEEKMYMATQTQLIIRKFKKHKFAMVGLAMLVIFYTVAIFCEFFAPQDMTKRDVNKISTPPTKIHFVDVDGNFSLRPFGYEIAFEEDPDTWEKVYVENTEVKQYLKFFVKGDKYKLLGFIPGDRHFIGMEKEGTFFLFGTDNSGRDLFSRILHALRISLLTGLVGVTFTFVLGCFFGGISGYYGGRIDNVIQRIIEFLMSMPSIPLWMALAATFPKTWSALQTYFAITIILSLIGWCELARIVRGKILELREEDFIMSARVSGASNAYIISKHLLPSFASYLIVNITLAIPGMILGETSLSFLGIGLRAPIVSLGVLLKDAQSISTISLHPWLMIPGIFIVFIVLAFNFVGDGLRDAADPYK